MEPGVELCTRPLPPERHHDPYSRLFLQLVHDLADGSLCVE